MTKDGRTSDVRPPDLAVSSPASDNTAEFAAGFVTSQPAQARAVLPPARVKPIITVGDPIPGATDADAEQRIWAPIPDGLAAYQTGEGLVLFANHEITSGGVGGRFRNARVSRLVLDPSTLSVRSGTTPLPVSGPAAHRSVLSCSGCVLVTQSILRFAQNDSLLLKDSPRLV